MKMGWWLWEKYPVVSSWRNTIHVRKHNHAFGNSFGEKNQAKFEESTLLGSKDVVTQAETSIIDASYL